MFLVRLHLAGQVIGLCSDRCYSRKGVTLGGLALFCVYINTDWGLSQ